MRKAAEQLHMSQPAVSKAIADLEGLLGVRLLDRSRHGVSRGGAMEPMRGRHKGAT
ncbi:LysR family transcriptional regulator [Burkholderia sp. LMG 13014]